MADQTVGFWNTQSLAGLLPFSPIFGEPFPGC